MELREYGPVAEAEEKFKQVIAQKKQKLMFFGYAIAFVLVFGLCTYLFLKNSNARINRIRLENKQLQLKYDSIANANKAITLELTNSQKKIDSLKIKDEQLHSEYEKNKQQIKNTKNKYEKNNRIDNFSSPDIIRYFTDSL